MYIKVYTVMYLHVRSQKVSTTFHFKSGLIRHPILAAPKLPQPGVNLVRIAAPPSDCSSRVSATIRKARAGLLGAGQSPVGQRRDMLHESLQYGLYFISYFIPCYTGINSVGTSIFL